MKLNIRKATKEDMPKIWEIEKQSRKHHAKISQKEYKILSKSGADKKAKLEFIKDLEKEVNSKKVIFFVAEASDEIVGWAWAKLGKWAWSNKPPKMLWVEDIGVLKKFRKKGIAKKLLKEVETIAKKKGMRYSYLTVWLKNNLAYNFYKKNKYDDFAIEMVKKLK